MMAQNRSSDIEITRAGGAGTSTGTGAGTGTALRARALGGVPLVMAGHDLPALIRAAAQEAQETLGPGDVLVVAQKIVSKAEGRLRRLADVCPGERARQLAAQCARPAALMQLILDDSSGIVRAVPAAVIVRHRSGHVLANAGIDASNVGPENAGDIDTVNSVDSVLLWPEDPDASARRIRAGLAHADGTPGPAVIIADSMGRAWRLGTLGTAIGVAGLRVVDDRRGQTDLFGRRLQATLVGVADTLAAIAVLMMGEGAEGTPLAIIRGAQAWISREDGPGASAGLRPQEQDMFQ